MRLLFERDKRAKHLIRYIPKNPRSSIRSIYLKGNSHVNPDKIIVIEGSISFQTDEDQGGKS